MEVIPYFLHAAEAGRIAHRGRRCDCLPAVLSAQHFSLNPYDIKAKFITDVSEISENHRVEGFGIVGHSRVNLVSSDNERSCK